jgi:hypothetical protein
MRGKVVSCCQFPILILPTDVWGNASPEGHQSIGIPLRSAEYVMRLSQYYYRVRAV